MGILKASHVHIGTQRVFLFPKASEAQHLKHPWLGEISATFQISRQRTLRMEEARDLQPQNQTQSMPRPMEKPYGEGDSWRGWSGRQSPAVEAEVCTNAVGACEAAEGHRIEPLTREAGIPHAIEAWYRCTVERHREQPR